MAFASAAAETSVTNAEALVAALQSGDLSASKAAYMKLRPEYEMIEHLYELFPNSDRCARAQEDGVGLLKARRRRVMRGGHARKQACAGVRLAAAGWLCQPWPSPACSTRRSDIDSRPDAHQYGEAYIKGLESTPGAIFKVRSGRWLLLTTRCTWLAAKPPIE